MKKTTYILVSLAVLGLAASIIPTIIAYGNREEFTTGHHRPCELGISEPISEVALSVLNKETHLAQMFNGLDIAISDTVVSPQLCVDSIFLRYLTTDFNNGKLSISLTLSDFKDKIVSISKRPKGPHSVRLTLPGNTLRNVATDYGRLSIRGLDTESLTLCIGSRLTLENCHIDSAFITTREYTKTKFKECSFEYMKIALKDNYIKIDCCDSTSLIKKLDLEPSEHLKTDLDLNEANIDTFRLDNDSRAKVNIRIKYPANLTK